MLWKLNVGARKIINKYMKGPAGDGCRNSASDHLKGTFSR